MVKYGVVGAGYFGAELARYMQKNDGAEITFSMIQIMQRRLQKNWEQK